MTQAIEIPIALDVPLYAERITLDGVEYVFRFDWNERELRWYFDLGLPNGTWLVRGVKIVSDWPLLRRFKGASFPKGHLIAIDLSDQGGEPPVFQDLGRRVKILYHPAA